MSLFLIVLFLPILFANGQNTVKITSDFPGGNIVVNKISGDSVWLKPDLSFTKGEWFYWYFKISGISEKNITFTFDQNNVFSKYGPAFSLNNDFTWKWYGENRIANNGFSFSFSEQDTIAFFSVAFPYTEKNLNEFLGNLKNRELLKTDTLCFSPKNRVIEKITIPATSEEPKHKVLITVRHHACEMMASYVLEGIIESLLNNKNLQSLREGTEFLIIPFMDKDGVENGEQGKNRVPRDHNRD
ncbi:MAG: M14 family zinc carboxypeptidase [Draconibacterium sp.]